MALVLNRGMFLMPRPPVLHSQPELQCRYYTLIHLPFSRDAQPGGEIRYALHIKRHSTNKLASVWADIHGFTLAVVLYDKPIRLHDDKNSNKLIKKNSKSEKKVKMSHQIFIKILTKTLKMVHIYYPNNVYCDE